MPASLEHMLHAFAQHGITDQDYLCRHYARFNATREEVRSRWSGKPGARVLDLGAHWLHQAWLWAQDGFAVTAVDLPVTFDQAAVRSLAAASAIDLVACRDLERAGELGTIADDSIDLLLFTETIEHLTFNPVQLWRQLYRLLAPGARIVVTTPNYYHFDARAWQVRRFLRGHGGGLTVDDLLSMPTHGHHWREFSMSELARYFALLSPDFVVSHRGYPAAYANQPARNRLSGLLQRRIPGLRQSLHLELDLPEKRQGIVASPQW